MLKWTRHEEAVSSLKILNCGHASENIEMNVPKQLTQNLNNFTLHLETETTIT